MNKIFAYFAVVAMGAALAACSTGSSAEAIEINMEMSEFAFTPAHLEFHVGQEVTINLVNAGALGHEIMFGREVKMVDGQPQGYMTDMFAAADMEPRVTMLQEGSSDMDEHSESGMEEEHGHEGFMVEVPAGGGEYSMQFTVTEDMLGDWEIGCFDQNGVHYNAGMLGTLTVSP